MRSLFRLGFSRVVGIFVFVLFSLVTNLSAFQVKVVGQYDFTYTYISRLGSGDLFGNVDIAQSSQGPGLTTIGLSGPWNLTVVPEGLSSKGSDASWGTQRLRFFPRIEVNKAVSFTGDVSIQGSPNGLYVGGPNWTGLPHYNSGIFVDSRSESRLAGYGVPVLRTLSGDFELPWGRLRIGRFGFGFGLGWSGMHYDEYAMSGVMLESYQGPFSYIISTSFGGNKEFTDPYDTRNANKSQFTIGSLLDKNEKAAIDTFLAFRYHGSLVDVGLGWNFLSFRGVHSDPFMNRTLRDDITGSTIAAPLAYGRAYTSQTDYVPVPADVYLNTLCFYSKYMGDHFFFNAEYDQQFLLVRKQKARAISGFPHGWMLEVGSIYGPAKLSVAHFFRTGHQRSGGVLDFSRRIGSDGVTQASDRWQEYFVFGGAQSSLSPYSWLIGFYGGGNNAYNQIGSPLYTDFVGYAFRIDYSLAANLNIYSSYLYARRQSSTGSWWGQYSGGVLTPVTLASNVPDNNLGWEANLGLDWKLLENTTFSLKSAYWKPGEWFKWAYSDLSISEGLDDPVSGNNVRINPRRTISPIFGALFSVKIDF